MHWILILIEAGQHKSCGELVRSARAAIGSLLAMGIILDLVFQRVLYRSSARATVA